MATPKLAIVLEGGLIQQVFANQPIQYALIDLDAETQDRTMKITNNDGVEVEIYRYTNPIEEAEVNPEVVDHYFEQVTKEGGDEDEEDD
jgi:hypothetical protein